MYLASETCALDTIGAEFIRDVEPGEIVTIDKDGIKSDKSLCLKPEEQARCVFEYIYFARPDSYFDGYKCLSFKNYGRKVFGNGSVRLMQTL